MTDSRPLWGLVLAGGQSRRMGSDKARLEKDGETQLSRGVALLSRHAARVFVSARSEQKDDAERSRFPMILDRYDNLGPVAGILSAMDEHPQVDWIVLACDLPNVDDDSIARLTEAHGPDTPFTAYASSHDGLPEPLCAIYGAGARNRIDAFIAEGIRCPRKMLIRSNLELLAQPRPESLDNVNTPEDLAGSGARFAS